MCENKNIDYDNLSEEILDNLLQLTEQIQTVSNITYDLLQNSSMVDDPDFLEYIEYFRTSKYYHYRCQGYMENIVITKCYSSQSLCYWYEELVTPTVDSLLNAFSIVDIYPSLNKELSCLHEEFVKMIEIVNDIDYLISKYDLYYNI